jgi:hypothetical protein
MFEIINVKSKDVFPLIQELLLLDKKIRLTVTGTSMYPFLRANIDSVELYHKDFCQVYIGDIVLVVRKNKEYVLHRVLHKKKDCFYIVGDAQEWIEGPLNPEQLIAVVSSVWRRNKIIKCSSIYWRLLTLIWIELRPFRYFIINSYGRLRRLL